MKYWLKTNGAIEIASVAVALSILVCLWGNVEVNLPTMVGGIRFTPRLLSELLSWVLPSFVAFNRSKLNFPLAAHTRRLSRWFSLTFFPLSTLGISQIFLLSGNSNDLTSTFTRDALIFGSCSEIANRISAVSSPLIAPAIYTFFELFTLGGFSSEISKVLPPSHTQDQIFWGYALYVVVTLLTRGPALALATRLPSRSSTITSSSTM